MIAGIRCTVHNNRVHPSLSFVYRGFIMSVFNRFLSLFLASLFLVCILAGCSSNQSTQEKERLSEQQYYEAAHQAIDGKNYLLAIENLTEIESRFPFGRYAIQAQLDLIFSYYKSLDYSSAQLQAEKFIRQHPDHPDIDYVYYMKGLSSYSIDRGFLARLLPSTASERDISAAKQAFSEFARFIQKFPKSPYAPDARQRMIYLKNTIAEHEVHVARYYIKRRAYLAAANRGSYIVENFPSTPASADALAIMAKSYKQLGMHDLSVKAEALLAKEYPTFKELDKNGKIREEYTIDAQDQSWLSILSFGLLGK